MVVRPNPVLFELPEPEAEDCKENQSPRQSLLYRSVFAVLTLDSILVYDTHHSRPLSIIRGLHYAGLTDCCWSKDGLNLMVCSTDGYLSIINFSNGELGKVYQPPMTEETTQEEEQQEQVHTIDIVRPEDLPPIPPCEPGPTAVLQAPPAKRAKTRITPTLVVVSKSPTTSTTPPPKEGEEEKETDQNSVKRSSCAEAESVGAAVTKLSLCGEQPKKKKRVQPILLSS